MEIVNAVIESVRWDTERSLSLWVMLDYGGSGQGFGGYSLYIPEDWVRDDDDNRFKTQWNYCGHFVYRLLQVTEKHDLADLPGTAVRVKRENGFNGAAIGIGHIVRDQWFVPRDEFEKVQEQISVLG